MLARFSRNRQVARLGARAVQARAFSDGAEERRVFSQYNVYTPNGGLSVGVAKPVLSENARGDYLFLKKAGCIFLSFAKPFPNSDSIDWKSKEYIPLNVDQIGHVLALEAGEELDISSGIKTGIDGELDNTSAKQLLIRSNVNDNDKVVDYTYKFTNPSGHAVELPIKKGEHEVLKCLLHHTLPHLLAWSAAVHPPRVQKNPEPYDAFASTGPFSS